MIGLSRIWDENDMISISKGVYMSGFNPSSGFPIIGQSCKNQKITNFGALHLLSIVS
jgi:hypothetical protein